MEVFHLKIKIFALQLFTKLNVKIRNTLTVLAATFANTVYFECFKWPNSLSPKLTKVKKKKDFITILHKNWQFFIPKNYFVKQITVVTETENFIILRKHVQHTE